MYLPRLPRWSNCLNVFLNQLICFGFQAAQPSKTSRSTLVDSQVELKDVTLDFASRLAQWDPVGGLVVIPVGRWKFCSPAAGSPWVKMYRICDHLHLGCHIIPYIYIYIHSIPLCWRSVMQDSWMVFGWSLPIDVCSEPCFCLHPGFNEIRVWYNLFAYPQMILTCSYIF